MGTRQSLIALAVSLGLPLLAGGVGAAVTVPALAPWYADLAKPAWTPPAGVFGPVWTLLYLAMGLASWLVWRQGWRRHEVRRALLLLAGQLVLNLLWSIFFFGLRAPGLAFLDIMLLWIALAAALTYTRQVSGLGTALLVPYLGWVSFAGALNAAVWYLNR